MSKPKKNAEKQMDINQKIKEILEDVKLDLAIDLRRIEPKTDMKQRKNKLWDQFYQEEKLVQNLPIKKSIEKKRSDADMGMWIKEIHYTPEEQQYLDTNPHEQQMAKIIDQIQNVEENEYNSLKQRLKTKKAYPEEIKQLENLEMKIWDSGKELLGDKGNDLPAFTVDSTFYEVFNDSDGFFSSLNRKVECKLRGKLNQLGYDYENETYADKVIIERGEKLSKAEFLKKNSYCKESDLE